MPVLESIELCTYTPFTGGFENANATLHPAAGSPDWFGMSAIGVNFITGDTVYQTTVDPTVNDPGVYTISIVNAGEVEVGTVVVTITDCPPDEEYNICMGTFVVNPTLAAPPTVDGDVWQVIAGPDWFNLFSVPFSHSFNFVPPIEGTFIVLLQASEPGYEETLYRIQINVTNCFELYDGCNERNLNISWKLPEGAWKSYVFQGKKIYGLEIGNSATFKDENEIAKFSAVDEVRDSIDVASGSIPKSHVDYVKLLKASIQVFLWNPVTNNWDIPVLIDKSSFQLYREGDNVYKYEFKFIFGAQIKIQNQ